MKGLLRIRSILGQAAAVAAALLLAGEAVAQPQPVFRVAPDQPAQEVLEVPLRNARIIELARDARDVRLADPEIADVLVTAPREIYFIGRRVGSTNAFLFDEDRRQMLRLEIRVVPDTAPVQAALTRLMPGENIAVETIHDTLVLTGNVHSARAAENARQIARRFTDDDAKLVNMLKLRSDQQVMLNVRVVEMRREVAKQLGFDFDLGEMTTKFELRPRGLPSTLGSVGFGKIFGPSGNDFRLLVDALETENLVRTLAEPNLTAVSGEAASFLVGGEFPFPVPRGGDDPPTIQFKEFGVRLIFTPVVLDSGLISLRMTAEVSELIPSGVVVQGTSVPGLNVRRTETTVELPSGGSLVAAGLLQSNIEDAVRGVPWLMDVPILGQLFRSNEFRRNETELVIAVTPRLVRPIAEQPVPTPADGFSPGGDIDRLLLGRLHEAYRAPGEAPPPGRLAGPYGYVME